MTNNFTQSRNANYGANILLNNYALRGMCVALSPINALPDAEVRNEAPARTYNQHPMRQTYQRGSTASPIRCEAAPTGDSVVDSYQPRTELGRKLLALRKAYLTAGGALLSSDELDYKVKQRRGRGLDA